MGYSSSFSSSGSSTTSTGTTTWTSTNDESSSFSTNITASTETSSPDGSDGLAAVLGGEAVAAGEDTLAVGNISGQIADDGTLTTASGSATMTAVSEAPEGETAYASADTFGGVSDGADFVFSYTADTDSSEQSATGSVATSTSTTSLTAYDIGSVSISDDSADDDDVPVASGEPEADLPSVEVDDDVDLDGNVALIEFDAEASGEDTPVMVDAYALVVEDELSITGGYIEMAVD